MGQAVLVSYPKITTSTPPHQHTMFLGALDHDQDVALQQASTIQAAAALMTAAAIKPGTSLARQQTKDRSELCHMLLRLGNGVERRRRRHDTYLTGHACSTSSSSRLSHCE